MKKNDLPKLIPNLLPPHQTTLSFYRNNSLFILYTHQITNWYKNRVKLYRSSRMLLVQ